MDGTLLDPWERVSGRTAEAVRRVEASDTPFVLVTGRPPRWMPHLVEELGVAGVAVCSNGAVLYDTAADRVLAASAIDPVLLHDVAHELHTALPGCAMAVERSTDRAADRVEDQFLAEAEFRRVWPNQDIHVVAPAELVGRPAVKLLVLHEKLSSDELARAAAAIVDGQLQMTFSTGAGLLELSAPGIDKASGLAAVASQFGVEPADVVAFGDMPNDVPMIEWVGHGVAMGNAHQRVLDVADEVTAPNSADGVAQVLERWWS